MTANVRAYESLRCKCTYVSRYTEVAKRTELLNRPKGAHEAKRSKPSASNGLYALLCAANYFVQIKTSSCALNPKVLLSDSVNCFMVT